MPDHSIHVSEDAGGFSPEDENRAPQEQAPAAVLLGADARARLWTLAENLFYEATEARLAELPKACSADDTIRFTVSFTVLALAGDLQEGQ